VKTTTRIKQNITLENGSTKEGGGLLMNNRRIAPMQDINSFDFVETKKNVNIYFENLDKLRWEQAKLNAQKGLTVNYDFSLEDKQQAYISVGKDEFNLSAIETNNEEIKRHLSDYHWAKSILTEQEQLYIKEYFINHKYEDEIVGLLGFNSSDSGEFRKLKRRAIYKFAYVLSLIK